MNPLTVVVILLMVAQFTPQGQRFLSTDAGSATFVAVAAACILVMLPGLIMGNLLNVVFIGIWAYMAYPRLGSAQRYFKTLSGKLFKR